MANSYRMQHDESISKLRNVYSWRSLDFTFANDVARETAIKSGRFKPGAAIPIDVDVHYGNFINASLRNCKFIAF
jgi:hypothetical protein